MVLYRPVGENELKLIKESNFKRFPKRLPEQPIFYPVVTEKYACEIAFKWNKVYNEAKKGYALRFEIDDNFINQYDVHIVGASYHKEYWIPAESLEDFNDNIIGNIEIIKEF